MAKPKNPAPRLDAQDRIIRMKGHTFTFREKFSYWALSVDGRPEVVGQTIPDVLRKLKTQDHPEKVVTAVEALETFIGALIGDGTHGSGPVLPESSPGAADAREQTIRECLAFIFGGDAAQFSLIHIPGRYAWARERSGGREIYYRLSGNSRQAAIQKAVDWAGDVFGLDAPPREEPP